MVIDAQGEIGGDLGGSGVSRRTKNSGGRSKRPTERVLTTATTDDQNPHWLDAFFIASENARAAFLTPSATSLTAALASFA